jgi:trans-aconitate methyltransferase
MRSPASPFTDPDQVRGPLYVSAGRLARRTSALHRARVGGRDAAEVIADLAAWAAVTSAPVIADIGCGRGTTTCLLAGRLPQARIIAIDLSAALLTTARNRLPAAARAGAARADFHRLPLRDGACGLAVAAFCLYHSRSPGEVIAEIARCLAPGATAIIAVKSENSYQELDLLMATLATSPKYELPATLTSDAAMLADELRRRLPDQPFTMTSVVAYLVAQRKTATP